MKWLLIIRGLFIVCGFVVNDMVDMIVFGLVVVLVVVFFVEVYWFLIVS